MGGLCAEAAAAGEDWESPLKVQENPEASGVNASVKVKSESVGVDEKTNPANGSDEASLGFAPGEESCDIEYTGIASTRKYDRIVGRPFGHQVETLESCSCLSLFVLRTISIRLKILSLVDCFSVARVMHRSRSSSVI
jgi:hypothetical protein